MTICSRYSNHPSGLKINLFTPSPRGVNWFSSLPLGPG